MDSLIKLAAWALIEYGKASHAATVAAALCAGLAITLALAALGCAASALWMFALPSLGAVGAPLVVAAALAILALILAAATWLVLRDSRHRPNTAVPQLLLAEAARLFTEHKGSVLIAAVIAGMATANGNRKS